MRVFVSSTCYDLVDLRAELAVHLNNMGITPVLSDDKLSAFKIQHDVHSIQTCLVNVESCDSMILILDRRYGPTLESFGFDKVSATHLEYRKAVELGIPIHFFVRDKLEADHSIWKKNSRDDSLKLPWAQNNTGLLRLIDEQKNHEPGSERSNWFATYTNSVDLRAAVSKQFEADLLPETLKEAIANNRFPFFQMTAAGRGKESTSTHGCYEYDATVTAEVIGEAPALNCQFFGNGEATPMAKRPILSPGSKIPFSFGRVLRSGEVSTSVTEIIFDTVFGVQVKERYLHTIEIISGRVLSDIKLEHRKFRRGKNVKFEILVEGEEF